MSEKLPVDDANDKPEPGAAETGAAASDVEALPQAKVERVPRSQRRGLLAFLQIVPEVTDPYQYGKGTKWLMTGVVALAGMTSSTGSSIFYPALDSVTADFGSSPTVTNLSLAFYMLAMAVTPLWWSMYSELLGRRTIYLVSFLFFIILAAIGAVSVNITMLVVFRTLMGGAAASVQAVGAGTVADLWAPANRGLAMGGFFLGPLCGPGIAPIIGGALTQRFGWRSTQWFLCVFGAAAFLLILLCLPETLRRKPASDKPQPKLTPGEFLKRCVRPLALLALLRHPPIFAAIYAGALSFGVTFVVYVSLQATFLRPPYSFTNTQLGLLYLAPTIGYAISAVLGGKWVDYIMAREARKAGRYNTDGSLRFLPEDRMKENAWLAAALFPGMFIWYGWAADRGLHWAVCAAALLLCGLFGMILYGAVTTVLTEFTPQRASSGIALNNFARNILSCTAAVVTQPLIDAVGIGWMATMVGLFAFVTILATLAALQIRGPRWRVAMDRKFNGQAK